MPEQHSVTPGSSTKNSTPRLAVLLLWYPLFTQPFIFRDIEALKQHLPVHVYTLYGRNLRLCSREMCQAADEATRLGIRALPRILWSVLRLALRHPVRLARLFADNVCCRWSSLEILGENLWAFLCGLHLAPLLQKEGIDLLYAPWPRGTTTAARTIFQCTGIGYVTSARGDNLNPADPDLVVKLRDACAVRTNNQADAGRIRDLLAGTTSHGRTPQVAVIYNSLTLHVDRLAPLPMRPPVRLLAAGRFDVTKGFDVLLRACAELARNNVDFRLTLVGGGGAMMGLGKLDSTLHALCRDLHLEDRVTFPGLVSHDTFPDILRAHDIFAAPCVIAPTGQRDGIPNTVIEAMSFGLPVVASNVNALPEIVRHRETGLLVPPGNPTLLALALQELIDHPEQARCYGARAAQLARELFSQQTNGSQLASLFIQAHRERT